MRTVYVSCHHYLYFRPEWYQGSTLLRKIPLSLSAGMSFRADLLLNERAARNGMALLWKYNMSSTSFHIGDAFIARRFATLALPVVERIVLEIIPRGGVVCVFYGIPGTYIWAMLGHVTLLALR